MLLRPVLIVGMLAALASAWPQTHPTRFRTESDARAGRYKAATTYVEFGKPSPVTALANAAYRQAADRARKAWLADARASTAGRKPIAPYEFSFKPVISIVRDNLVSGYVEEFSYLGGAHPNTTYQAITVGLVNGKPKVLRFKDIVLAPTVPSSAFQTLALPKVNAAKRKKGADPIESLDGALADAFVVTPTSLFWVIAPYEAGAYAEGAYFPKASFAECEGILDPAGPLRSLLPNRWVGEAAQFPCEAYFLEKIMLPEGATLEARVFDIEEGEGNAFSTYREGVRVPPFAFTARATLKNLKPGRSYALSVRIVADGETWFSTPEPISVTREGWKQTKRIRLVSARG